MFEEIFFPRTAERYRAAPLVEQRERYLVHLKETGARRSTLRKCANDQLSLVRLLNLKEGDRSAAFRRSRPRRRCGRSRRGAGATGLRRPRRATRFVNHGVQWLRFLGLARRTRTMSHHPHDAEVADL